MNAETAAPATIAASRSSAARRTAAFGPRDGAGFERTEPELDRREEDDGLEHRPSVETVAAVERDEPQRVLAGQREGGERESGRPAEEPGNERDDSRAGQQQLRVHRCAARHDRDTAGGDSDDHARGGGLRTRPPAARRVALRPVAIGE